MSLLIIGGAVIDLIITRTPRLPAWPRHTEFTAVNLVLLPEAPLVTLGGNAANAAYVAACAGARVHLLANLGNDPFGTLGRHWLEEVGCRLLRAPRGGRTAVNVTAANVRNARATFFYPGSPPPLPRPNELPTGTTHFLACGWPHASLPRLATCLRMLGKKNIFTAMDIGPFLQAPWNLTALHSLFPSLRLLLGNEHELNALTRSDRLKVSLQKLRRLFSGDVVVKRGARGAWWWPQDCSVPHHVPAWRVRPVNTVGAGDSFNGALLAALVQRMEFPQALSRAVRTAAKVVASPHGVLGAKREDYPA